LDKIFDDTNPALETPPAHDEAIAQADHGFAELTAVSKRLLTPLPHTMRRLVEWTAVWLRCLTCPLRTSRCC